MNTKDNDYYNKKQLAISQFNDALLFEAKHTCTQLCATKDDPEVFTLMGLIYGRLLDFPESSAWLSKAVNLYPEYTAAHFNLAVALKNQAKFSSAIEELEIVLAQNPDHYEAHLSLGDISETIGNFIIAEIHYKNAQRLKPKSTAAVAGLASIYERQGKYSEALDLIKPYIKNEPLNAYMALVYGRLAHSLGLQKDAVTRLEKIAENEPGIPAINFQLGRLYEDLGKFNKSFQHYKKGNDLQAPFFDSDLFGRRVDRLTELFSAPEVSAASRATFISERPIFIVGMMRSGTSLVEQILSSNPDIFGAGELPYIGDQVITLQNISPKISTYNIEQLNYSAQRYLEKVDILNSHTKYFVDKLPINFLNIGYIWLMFPGALIIHCQRDPLDTCLSCYFQNFFMTQRYTNSLETLGQFYLDYSRLMDHWKAIFQHFIYDVRYEDLVSSPEDEIRKLVQFTGLPWNDNYLDHSSNKRIVRTASYKQVRNPIYKTSIGRWHNFTPYIENLINTLDTNHKSR